MSFVPRVPGIGPAASQCRAGIPSQVAQMASPRSQREVNAPVLIKEPHGRQMRETVGAMGGQARYQWLGQKDLHFRVAKGISRRGGRRERGWIVGGHDGNP